MDENFHITLVMYFSSEDIKIFSFPVPMSVITLRIHLSVTQMTYCWGVLRVCIIKRSENSLKCQHFNIQSNLYNCWKWYQNSSSFRLLLVYSQVIPLMTIICLANNLCGGICYFKNIYINSYGAVLLFLLTSTFLIL